jgi:hypothetical protein
MEIKQIFVKFEISLIVIKKNKGITKSICFFNV